jgi:hypothetical protein
MCEAIILKEPENPTFRNEVKHYINRADYMTIRQRMQAVARPDSHAGADGLYHIRSLYFDNIYDKAMQEKQQGLAKREKFRLRFYNGNTDFIKLEKKTKVNGVGYKASAKVTAEQCERLIKGDISWMPESGNALIVELYAKMKSYGLKPKTIVDYIREPFIYEPGNVRVTLDSQIRTGIQCIDFLNPDVPTVRTSLYETIIMEVKWDEMLPDIIRQAVQLPGRKSAAFSKYVACRMFG